MAAQMEISISETRMKIPFDELVLVKQIQNQNYQLQGGRAQNELCMPWTPLRGVAALRRSV